jgi:hypothetical protein
LVAALSWRGRSACIPPDQFQCTMEFTFSVYIRRFAKFKKKQNVRLEQEKTIISYYQPKRWLNSAIPPVITEHMFTVAGKKHGTYGTPYVENV